MNKFSQRSRDNLKQCHNDLRIVAEHAIQYVDFTVICGYRGEHEQNKAYDDGFSKLRYPNSKHNKQPSEAFDFMPYPFKGWDDIAGFEKIGHMMLAIAGILKQYGVIESDLSYGGDWDFKDYPHIQIQ
jgi:peptidoglycan LD-endopeptidase CwlK